MLELAQKRMSGQQEGITDFSSVADTADDFISTIETDDFSLWDMVGEGFTGELPPNLMLQRSSPSCKPKPTPNDETSAAAKLRF